MMNTVHIFHHNDLDGKVSAAIVFNYFKAYMRRYRLYKFYSINYSDTIDTSNIKDYDAVIFVDYSFTNNENFKILDKLAYNNKNKILWIDHHQSSLDTISKMDSIGVYMINDVFTHLSGNNGVALKWNDHYNNLTTYDDMDKYNKLTILIDTEFSASALSYYWCCNAIKPELIKNKYALVMYLPPLINYVNDHDLWLHKLNDYEEFYLGYEAEMSNIPPREIFDFLDISLFEVDNPLLGRYQLDYVRRIIRVGEYIVKYKRNYDKYVKSTSGFEFSIKYSRNKNKELKCYAVNGHGNSSIVEEEYNKYDAVCIFHYRNDNTYKYSFFSRIPEITKCNEIAESLANTKGGISGGGHKGAAGLIHKNMLLSPDCIITIK